MPFRPRGRWIAAIVLTGAALLVARVAHDAVPQRPIGSASPASVSAARASLARPAAITAAPNLDVGAESDPTALPAAEQAAVDAAIRRHFEALAAAGDPHQQLVALAYLQTRWGDATTADAAREAIRKLFRSAPDDPLLAAAQAWYCGSKPKDCPDESTQAWVRVDPDNAAAWTGPLRAAQDGTQIDRLLAGAARASRWDSNMQTLALETVASFDDLQLPPIQSGERRVLTGFGFGIDDAERRRFFAASAAWAMPMPAYAGLSRNCRPPITTARARSCRTVFERMATASTLIEQNIAASGLLRLARTPAEARMWADRRRSLQWQSSQFAKVITGANYWDDFIRYGEVQAMRRALARQYIPLVPPPGWKPR